MNKENFDFLRDSLTYLGFKDKAVLCSQLMDHMESQTPSFQLETETYFEERYQMRFVLFFRHTESTDRYVLTSYKASLCNDENMADSLAQTFHIFKGWGVTAKEAFNLLQGRSVNKDLTSFEGEKYNAWLELNLKEKDQYDNHKVKYYRTPFAFDLEKALDQYPIRELRTEEQKTRLIKSLKKGNIQLVCFEKPSKTENMYIEANPSLKTINIYPPANRYNRRQAFKQDPPYVNNSDDPLTGCDEIEENKEEEVETESSSSFNAHT